MRALAHEFDLPNKDRKDSQGICFLGKLKFTEFVRHHIGEKLGPLVEVETGEEVGIHKGFWFYTIGQRQGLGLAGGPWYVTAKRPEDNTVFISRQYYTDDKLRDTFTLGSCNWIAEAPQKDTLRVKVRHGEAFHDATVTKDAEATYTIKLHERDQGLAEGQYAVVYDGSHCLGGGIISHENS